MTRIGDALRANTTSNLVGAPETAPEGAHVLGEVPQNVRGLWLQRSQMISEAKAADAEIADLEAKLAAAKQQRRTLSRYLHLANETIIVALDDKFGDDTPCGNIGMTADWQAFVESSDDGIPDFIKKLMGGKSVSGADVLKSMPEAIRKRVIPDGFEVVESLDELPSKIQMELSGHGLDDDAIVLYNKDKGKVAVISVGMGSDLDDDMPDFLKGMFDREPGESRMAL